MEMNQLRFGGIARLYGQDALERFLKAHVLVVGIGGVGSWTVEALARSGIGKITLVDLDEICITNINRQLHAREGQIGRLKTDSMAERVKEIHPECEIQIMPTFFNESTYERILETRPDVVIDAIDQVSHKALLLAESFKRGFHVITCGGAGGRRDPSQIRVNDLAYSGKDQLLHQVRKRLRQEFGFEKVPQGKNPDPFGIEAIYTEESPYYSLCDGSVTLKKPTNIDTRLNCTTGFGSVSHVTSAFGMFAAGRALEFLAKN